jgi:hypothetical protein
MIFANHRHAARGKKRVFRVLDVAQNCREMHPTTCIGIRKTHASGCVKMVALLHHERFLNARRPLANARIARFLHFIASKF